jgi:hypothetical protein
MHYRTLIRPTPQIRGRGKKPIRRRNHDPALPCIALLGGFTHDQGKTMRDLNQCCKCGADPCYSTFNIANRYHGFVSCGECDNEATGVDSFKGFASNEEVEDALGAAWNIQNPPNANPTGPADSHVKQA